MNDSKHVPLMLHGLLFTMLILAVGCAGSDRKSVSETAMSNNVAFWMKTCNDLKPGEVMSAMPDITTPGVRVYFLKWDTNCEVSVLLRKLDRVTCDPLGLTPMGIDRKAFVGHRIRDLSSAQQTELRALWEKRIVAALSLEYFNTKVDLLTDGLKNNELVIYYLLGGRHSSAEMGFSDTVQVFCVNAKNQLVSKNATDYASGYPLHFVDQTGNPADYLF